jgi:hypothetical protein
MIGTPHRGSSPVVAAVLAIIGIAFAAVPALGDPIIVPIRVTGGSAEVVRRPDVPSAQFSLTGPDGFAVAGGGVGFTPGGCDPCFGGHAPALSGSIFAHDGQVTFGDLNGEFDLFQGGGGVFDFHAGQFTLPVKATEPVVFRSPFTMTGSIALAPDPLGGSLTNHVFALSGSGVVTATFFPGQQFPQLGQEFRFDTASFDFSEPGAPTPEPSTLLLLGAGLVCVGRALNKHRDIRRVEV